MHFKTSKKFERRAFLRGMGGAMMALPALETFTARGARATSAQKINACFMGQMDGHIYDTHPGCGHPRGGNISITGSAPSEGVGGLAIAQLAGKEPLNLYAVRKGGGDDCFAFGVGGKIRVANNKPYDVFLTMMGLTPAVGGDPAVLARMQARDKSINDVPRGERRHRTGRAQHGHGGLSPPGRSDSRALPEAHDRTDEAVQTLDGKTLLDSSVVVWTNQMGNGYAQGGWQPQG
jgi:hypothetical protein